MYSWAEVVSTKNVISLHRVSLTGNLVPRQRIVLVSGLNMSEPG